jgi:tetratricopeptide (TPR) repeat protein
MTDLNGNFSEYSASPESPDSQQIIAADAVELPMTGVSVFEQFDTAPEVKPSAAEQAPQSTENKNTVLPETDLAPAEAPVIAPPRSRNNAVSVEDAAYAPVVAAYEAYGRGNFAEAEELYTAALAIEPNHRDGLAGLAAVYRQTYRTDQAVAAYEKLLALEPRNTAAAAAILAIRSGDVDWEIESELKLLLQRFPDSHHLHNALGSVYVGLEKWPDAKHEFLIAHKLAPENADYSYNTAVSLDRMGQRAVAQDYYRLALNSAGEQSGFDRAAILAHLDEFEQQRRERL